MSPKARIDAIFFFFYKLQERLYFPATTQQTSNRIKSIFTKNKIYNIKRKQITLVFIKFKCIRQELSDVQPLKYVLYYTLRRTSNDFKCSCARRFLFCFSKRSESNDLLFSTETLYWDIFNLVIKLLKPHLFLFSPTRKKKNLFSKNAIDGESKRFVRISRPSTTNISFTLLNDISSNPLIVAE